MRPLPRAILVLALLGTSFLANAQIFKLQGGASTLFGAEGGSVQFKAPNYDGQFGAGYLNGAFRFGANVHTRIMGYSVTAGDDTVRFDLPTDVFGANHFFLARGLGVSHPYGSGTAYAFFGVSTEGFMTPFFTAARSADRMAAIYVDHKFSPRLRLLSRNIVAHKRTSIQALEWTARPGVRLSAAAGLGSNQGYGASAVEVDLQNFKLKAAYIAEGKQFERVRTPALLTTELEKENISVAYRPVKGLTVSGSHQNILQPPYNGQDLVRASVDEASSTVTVAKFGFGGGIYHSRIDHHSTTGTNLFASRQISRRLSVAGNLFHSRPDVGTASKMYTGTTRFTLNQRLSLSSVVSRTDQQTTFGAGGEFTGNRLSLSVNSQTVYLPLRLDKPFQQNVTVNASAYLIGDVRVTVASLVAPDGRVRYTFGLSRFLYRAQGFAGSSGPSFRMAKYVVSGTVVDAAGKPFEGAAVHIGDQVVYSDSSGHFMVRLPKRGPYAVQVAPDEFIAPGLWDTVSAPSSAMANLEDKDIPIRIVIRRATKTN